MTLKVPNPPREFHPEPRGPCFPRLLAEAESPQKQYIFTSKENCPVVEDARNKLLQHYPARRNWAIKYGTTCWFLQPSHYYYIHHPCLEFRLSVPPAGASDTWVTPDAWATAAMASMARERLGAVLAAEKALKSVFAVEV